MIELNIPTLNASDVASTVSKSFGAPVESTNLSASTAQDFSAILTEMIGPALTLPLSSAPGLAVAALDSTNSLAPNTPGINVQQPQSNGPAVAQRSFCDKVANDKIAKDKIADGKVANDKIAKDKIADDKVASDESAQGLENAPKPDEGQLLQGQETPKPQGRPKTQDAQQNPPNPILFVAVAPVLVAPSVLIEQKPIVTHDVQAQQFQINGDPAAVSMQAPPSLAQLAQPPEIERAWADVKKFEFTVQKEATRPDGMRVQPLIAQADVQKQAIVTTDPMANIQLQQLPPRITAIEKLATETRLPDRAKPETARASADTTTPDSSMHFADASRSVEVVEQARPAHQVEIPQIPHVHIVRTVAMEVGDADSQVTVRIQERAGDISLQINAANEPLHQDLQSSVGSLVQALKQEQVQVSNVDVSRKSPIDKVRRMKEAN